MARYRKKPVVIEAFQWTGGVDQLEDPEWIVRAIQDEDVYFDQGVMMISTLEGNLSAQPGDWIIQGVEGEIYPCKPNIFAKTYEPVT